MSNQRYMMRGVSASKEDVHNAIKNIDKGIFPKAFCKIIPDILGGDPEYCNIRKSGGNNQPSMHHSCILAGNQYNKETTCYFKDKISCIQRCRRGKVRGSREVFAL